MNGKRIADGAHARRSRTGDEGQWLMLPPDRRSPARARRFVTSTVTHLGFSDLLDTIELLTSEIVTNAIVHARSEVELAVVTIPDGVRIEVADSAGSLIPIPRHPSPDSDGGRGLLLVDTLSAHWGVDRFGGRKSVWFEVVRREQPAHGLDRHDGEAALT